MRQVNWVSMGRLKQSALGLRAKVRSEEIGVFQEVGGVAGGDAADGGEVLFDAGLFEACLGEVLLRRGRRHRVGPVRRSARW